MKKSKLFLSLAALAGAAVAAPASAQFYLGGGVGAARATGINGSTVVLGVPVTVSGADSTKTSWKLLGGYQFTPHWGAEAQYSDLGQRSATIAFGAPINLSGTTTSARASQWSLAGTGTLPVGNNFYLMAKLGASRNHFDSVSLSLRGVTASSGSASKTGLLAGVGAGYNFNRNLGLRLEYENFGKFSSNGSINGGSIKGDNWALVLKYAF